MTEPVRGLAAAALLAGALAPGTLGASAVTYTTSRDGLGHWLYLDPQRGTALLRAHTEPIVFERGAPGMGPEVPRLILDIGCREGEAAVQMSAFIAKHPLDPPATRRAGEVLSPSGWVRIFTRWIGGNDAYRTWSAPAVVEVRAGARTWSHTGEISRRLETYSTESDYVVETLPSGALVALAALRPGEFLTVSVRTTGAASLRLHVEARYPADPAWTGPLANMLSRCGM